MLAPLLALAGVVTAPLPPPSSVPTLEAPLYGALVAAAPECLADTFDPARRRSLAAVNDSRRRHRLPLLAFSEALCRVAQQRAAELAAGGAAAAPGGPVVQLSRSLRGYGYEAYRWQEHSLISRGYRGLLIEELEARDPGSFRNSVLGDFEHLGVGLGEGPEGVVEVLLFALPQRTELHRQAMPLADLAAVRAAILDEVNRVRQISGLAAIAASPQLDGAAQRHAEDMLRHGYYDHRGRDGRTSLQRVVAARYLPRWVGENIARGLFTPEEVVARWMTSSGHRRNILDPQAREIGNGVAAGDGPGGFDTFWVMVLGRPRGAI
jgi:uncharacterized protein YkwD